jgi:hypothetical protein
MRPIGFSTGALAFGDFRRGLALVHQHNLPAVELSALRAEELPPLIEALDKLPLHGFRHIALHIPSRFSPADEPLILRLLESQRHRGWLYIAHPDALHTPEAWQRFGPQLCLENMDKRKPIGRNLSEMELVFQTFPEATWCFDIGHAHQIDSTMLEAWRLLDAFAPRLRQVHLSHVNSANRHEPLSRLSIGAYPSVASLIPEATPIILESVIPEDSIAAELTRARAALPAPGETPDPRLAVGGWQPVAAGD